MSLNVNVSLLMPMPLSERLTRSEVSCSCTGRLLYNTYQAINIYTSPFSSGTMIALQVDTEWDSSFPGRPSRYSQLRPRHTQLERRRTGASQVDGRVGNGTKMIRRDDNVVC